MAGKTPGTPRKSSSKKTSSKQAQSATPISEGKNVTPEGNVTPISATPISVKPSSVNPSSVKPSSQGNGNMAENKKYAHLEPGIQEEIRQRAYELYEERGRQDGFHVEDWSRAETEVLSRFHREKSA
jgi:hypothetical protein